MVATQLKKKKSQSLILFCTWPNFQTWNPVTGWCCSFLDWKGMQFIETLFSNISQVLFPKESITSTRVMIYNDVRSKGVYPQFWKVIDTIMALLRGLFEDQAIHSVLAISDSGHPLSQRRTKNLFLELPCIYLYLQWASSGKLSNSHSDSLPCEIRTIVL